MRNHFNQRGGRNVTPRKKKYHVVDEPYFTADGMVIFHDKKHRRHVIPTQAVKDCYPVDPDCNDYKYEIVVNRG